MDPSELAQYLAVLRDAGVSYAKVPVTDFPDPPFLCVALGDLRGEAGSASVSLVDRKGQPVNLDEGAPWNARDPLEEANFPGKAE